jgi:hypothetical protein
MSFRRDKQKTRKWQQWLQKHRDELLTSGIPSMVLEDERHWEHFLYEGYYTPVGSAEPILNVHQMERQQMESLCCLLERECVDSPGYVVLNRLQYLLKRGRHAQTSH